MGAPVGGGWDYFNDPWRNIVLIVLVFAAVASSVGVISPPSSGLSSSGLTSYVTWSVIVTVLFR
jgi:hypothetical protein